MRGLPSPTLLLPGTHVHSQACTTCLLGHPSFHLSLGSLSSSATPFRIRIAATFSGPCQGFPAATRPGLCLCGQPSLLFSLESLFEWASLQQGAGSRDPQQEDCESRDDEQVPNHCQAQGDHGGLQAQGGFLDGQPGSAGPHIGQHRFQLEVGTQHCTDVEQLVAVS